MSEIAKAIDVFRRTQSLQAAQALEVLLEDAHPDDPIALSLVDALAQFRPGGSDRDLLLDEATILSLIDRAEDHILGLPPHSATRNSWKTLASPTDRHPLHLARIFSDTEGERMRRGFIPRGMEDRWFVYFEDSWLNFHRSWTGAHIFAVRLEGSPFSIRVVGGWANGEQEQYRSLGTEQDAALLVDLIDSLFGDAANGG